MKNEEAKSYFSEKTAAFYGKEVMEGAAKYNVSPSVYYGVHKLLKQDALDFTFTHFEPKELSEVSLPYLKTQYLWYLQLSEENYRKVSQYLREKRKYYQQDFHFIQDCDLFMERVARVEEKVSPWSKKIYIADIMRGIEPETANLLRDEWKSFAMLREERPISDQKLVTYARNISSFYYLPSTVGMNQTKESLAKLFFDSKVFSGTKEQYYIDRNTVEKALKEIDMELGLLQYPYGVDMDFISSNWSFEALCEFYCYCDPKTFNDYVKKYNINFDRNDRYKTANILDFFEIAIRAKKGLAYEH